MEEEKSLQTTEVLVMEPVMEIIKSEVAEQKWETNDFLTNLDEVIDKIPPPNPALGTLEDKEFDSLSIHNDDQEVQALKENRQTLKNWM